MGIDSVGIGDLYCFCEYGVIMNIKRLYECPSCQKESESWDDANDCCEPTECFRCGECNKHYHDESESVVCCNQNENEKLKEQLNLG